MGYHLVLEIPTQMGRNFKDWSNENLPIYGPHSAGQQVVVWFHDNTMFYANDCQQKAWYHVDASAKPYTKGDGALMVADFVSAEFGWLSFPDGGQTAHHIIKPGKNKDGYFTSDNIASQANEAIYSLNSTLDMSMFSSMIM